MTGSAEVFDLSAFSDSGLLGSLDAESIFEEGSKPALPMHLWARKHRMVVVGPRQGMWDPRNAPFSEEPMAAFSDRRTTAISIACATQLMKTEFAVNCAVYSAALGHDVLFYEPDINLLRKFMIDRLRPSIAYLGISPQVVGGETGLLKRKDTMVEIRMPGGGTVLGLTPQMRSGKAAHSARKVVLDELDLMPDRGMIQVAQARTTAYGSDGCVVAVSVPSEDLPGTIWRRWSEGSQGIWKGLCPHCGELSGMDWGQVSFEKDPGGFWLPETAEMRCSECKEVWSEADRISAAQSGSYIHRHPDSTHRTFWIPGAAHIWRTIRGIVEIGASAWRAAQEDDDWETYRRFVNEWRGEPWDHSEQGLSARRLQDAVFDGGARDEETLGILDPRIQRITMGADVQIDSIHAEVTGWGVDDAGRVLCFGLRYFVIHGGEGESIEEGGMWDDLDREIRRSVWRHPSGGKIGIQRALIDSRYRTEIVRSWAQEKYREQLRARGGRMIMKHFEARILPCMSKARGVGRPIDLATGVISKGSKYRNKFFPSVVWLEADLLKEELYDSMKLDKSLPRGKAEANIWPANREEMGFTDAYFDELTSERKGLKQLANGRRVTEWTLKKGAGGRNEAWDCRVYSYAAALVEAAGSATLGVYLSRLTRRAAEKSGDADGNVIPFRKE